MSKAVRRVGDKVYEYDRRDISIYLHKDTVPFYNELRKNKVNINAAVNDAIRALGMAKYPELLKTGE